MKYNILLLGGTGTLSTAVLQESIKRGFQVTIMNRGFNNNGVPKDVSVEICDFKKEQELFVKFNNKNFDVIVDFLSRVPADIERVYPLFKDKCKQYIFISSACVYRRGKGDFPIVEYSPKPNKDWSYNVEKYGCELKLDELSKYAKSYYTIIRPYITYNDERIPVGIAPSYKYHKTIVERIKAGKPWFVWDDGKAITTVTYAADFAVGVVGLFLNEKARNEDFHITGDYSYSQMEVVEMLFKKLKIPINVVSIPTEEIARILPEYHEMLIGDRSLNAIFDNSKIKNAVPCLTFNNDLSAGLDHVISYWERTEPLYDYAFDARVDKLLSHKGIKTSYVRYSKSANNSRFLYLIFKYLPLRLANKLKKWA